MREILFRGKRFCNNKWMFGSLFRWNDGDCFIVVGDHRHSHYKVDPETVGQFTGLTDKNGKKIFEGDIIRAFGEIYACRWDDGNVEFGLSNKHESFGIAYVAGYDMEVIGNIHDNPELLEVE